MNGWCFFSCFVSHGICRGDPNITQNAWKVPTCWRKFNQTSTKNTYSTRPCPASTCFLITAISHWGSYSVGSSVGGSVGGSVSLSCAGWPSTSSSTNSNSKASSCACAEPSNRSTQPTPEDSKIQLLMWEGSTTTGQKGKRSGLPSNLCGANWTKSYLHFLNFNLMRPNGRGLHHGFRTSKPRPPTCKIHVVHEEMKMVPLTNH